MYRTHDLIPKGRTAVDIKLSLYPESNNQHIYKTTINNLGDYVGNARMVIIFKP